ncbi:UNVERIFIED_CONTAM: hypothetical protein Scaly_2147600 [Sesamum calycinum]|uniref:non-specific serine/threonine protein kinase n=1 Tax=Sesamum calycinum TaxID=2727403 RepID=A0AAW2MN16_9LAMI
MNSQSFSCFSFLHLLFAVNLLLLLQFPNGSSNPEEFYKTCGGTFSCGSAITGIRYPFRGSNSPPYCGHPSFVLTCDDQNNVTTIDIMNMTYRVLNISQTTQTMRIVREDIMDGTCPQEMVNTTLDYSIFDYASMYTNFTFLYGCPGSQLPGLSPISCGNNGVYMFPGIQSPGSCNASVMVPVLVTGGGAGGSVNSTGLDQVLQRGFEIRWKIGGKACSDCVKSKGRCGYNFDGNQTTCFCPDPPYVSDTCPMASEASPGNAQSPVVMSEDKLKVRQLLVEPDYETGNDGKLLLSSDPT